MESLFDLFVLSLFFCFVSGTYIWSYTILVRLSSKKTKNKTLDKKSIAVLVTGAIGLICIAYAFIEPFRLEVTNVKINSYKLKMPDQKLRIAHISDLHCDGIKRVVDKIPERIKKLKPDFVVFTGDACHNKTGLEHFRNCLTEIARICPTYVIRGNHDGAARKWDYFNGTGAIELSCTDTEIVVNGVSVWIGGVPVGGERCTEALLDKAPKNSFTVFLYHYPNGVLLASRKGVDLFCTGHTHGGQVRLPFYGAFITASRLSRKYDRGLFDFKGTKMHISQGTGMTALPIRFLAPPQISLIEVEPSEAR